MNVKNIEDFIADIDKTKLIDAELEDDCHEKIKKLTLIKKWVLRDTEFTDTVQITLENNPSFRARHGHHYGPNPKKRWETPVVDMENEEKIKQAMKEPRDVLPERVKKRISMELDYPVYDGSFYFKNGEKAR